MHKYPRYDRATDTVVASIQEDQLLTQIMAIQTIDFLFKKREQHRIKEELKPGYKGSRAWRIWDSGLRARQAQLEQRQFERDRNNAINKPRPASLAESLIGMAAGYALMQGICEP